MIIPSPYNIFQVLKYYEYFKEPPHHRYHGEDDPVMIDPYIYSFEVFQLVNKLYTEHFIQEYKESYDLPEDLGQADICSLVRVLSAVVMADRYSSGILSQFIAAGNLKKIMNRLRILKKEIEDRMYGSLLGLAVGDALGAPVEFYLPGTFTPVEDFRGGGAHNLNPGEWSDDTSLALSLSESLIKSKGFNPQDQMDRYVSWYLEGHLSVNGRCFDIGDTTREALENYMETGNPYSGLDHEGSAGNGSLMRLAPIPIYYFSNLDEVLKYARLSSCTTHQHPLVIQCCQYLALLIQGALWGKTKEELLSPDYPPLREYCLENELLSELGEVVEGSYKTKNPPEIRASGYVIRSLEAALWAFYNSDNFKDGVLMAVNLGDDADTVGAIYGQLAGAYYGEKGIPCKWLDNLAKKDLIKSMCRDLIYPKK